MPSIGQKEKDLMVAIKALGGVAGVEGIARLMGVSEDYAQQVCDYLVEKKHLVSRDRRFSLVTLWDGLEEDAKVLKDAARGRFTLGTYETPGLLVKAESSGAAQGREVHRASITRVRTVRDPAQGGDKRAPSEPEQQAREERAKEALERFTPVRAEY